MALDRPRGRLRSRSIALGRQSCSIALCSQVRFVLDFLATFLLLPSVYGMNAVLFNLFTQISGDPNTAQRILDSLQQGTAARISRVARLAGKLNRIIKYVSKVNKAFVDFVVTHASRLPILAKLMGVGEEAEAQKKTEERVKEMRSQKAATGGSLSKMNVNSPHYSEVDPKGWKEEQLAARSPSEKALDMARSAPLATMELTRQATRSLVRTSTSVLEVGGDVAAAAVATAASGTAMLSNGSKSLGTFIGPSSAATPEPAEIVKSVKEKQKAERVKRKSLLQDHKKKGGLGPPPGFHLSRTGSTRFSGKFGKGGQEGKGGNEGAEVAADPTDPKKKLGKANAVVDAQMTAEQNAKTLKKKKKAEAKVADKTSDTAPSRIGSNIIERFTGKVVLTLLLMLLTYSVFFDIPAVNLRDQLYLTQLESLVAIADATNSTASLGFDAVLGVITYTKPSGSMIRFPTATYVKVVGQPVFNLSTELNLSYSIVEVRRRQELVYIRENCPATLEGLRIETTECENVIVYDRLAEMEDETFSQIGVTLLMVIIIVLCIGLMAFDLALLLNPLERITKLIKIVTGKRWRKEMKKRREAATSQEVPEMSASEALEQFELEAYYGLRMVNLFFMDVEEAR